MTVPKVETVSDQVVKQLQLRLQAVLGELALIKAQSKMQNLVNDDNAIENAHTSSANPEEAVSAMATRISAIARTAILVVILCIGSLHVLFGWSILQSREFINVVPFHILDGQSWTLEQIYGQQLHTFLTIPCTMRKIHFNQECWAKAQFAMQFCNPARFCVRISTLVQWIDQWPWAHRIYEIFGKAYSCTMST